MCLSSGVAPTEELSGAPYVQEALSTFLGRYGYHFIVFSLVLFAFTTLIGNLFYVDTNLAYINGKEPSKKFMVCYRILAAVIILFGTVQEADLAWNISDLLMGIMAIINLPTILILGKKAIDCLKDYEKQKDSGKNPVFHYKDIGITEELDFWK